MGILGQVTSTKCGIGGVVRTVNYIYGGVGGVVKRMNPNYVGFDPPITSLKVKLSTNWAYTNVTSDSSTATADKTNVTSSVASSTYGSTATLSNNNAMITVASTSVGKGLCWSGYLYAVKPDGSEVQLSSNTTVSGVTSISITVRHYIGSYSSSSWYNTYWSHFCGTAVWETTTTFTSWTSAHCTVGVGLASGPSTYSVQYVTAASVNGRSVPFQYVFGVSGW